MWKNGFAIPNIRPVRCGEVTSKRRCQLEPKRSVRYNVSASYKFFYESFTVVSSFPKIGFKMKKER